MANVREHLIDERRKLKEERLALSRQEKREKQTMRRKLKEWVFNDAERRSILAVYIVSEYSLHCTADFVQRVGKKHTWQPKATQDVEAMVEELFLGASDDELLSLADASSSDNVTERKAAYKQTQEWGMAAWTRRQNLQSVGPSTAGILERMELVRLAMPQNVRPKSWGLVMTGTARKHATRWRKARGGRFGKLRIGERPTQDVMWRKAFALWQWSRYLVSQVPAPKIPLFINIDETSICLFPGSRGGNIFVHKDALPLQLVTQQQQRTYLTYVAFICNDDAIQLKLPQIIISNESTIPAGRLEEFRAMCPPNVHVWREESAWINGRLWGKLLRTLAEALRPYMSTHQPIVASDAYRAHFSTAVWIWWMWLGLWPLIVCASMTWALQPLDVVTFAPFKLRLQRLFQDARINNADNVDILRMLFSSLLAAINQVVECGSWGKAFLKCGLAPSQVGVSQTLRRTLGIPEGVIAVPGHRPSLGQLRLCFPRKCNVPETPLFRPLSHPPKAPGVSAASSSSSAPIAEAPHVPPMVWPIALRTRSRAKAIAKSLPMMPPPSSSASSGR